MPSLETAERLAQLSATMSSIETVLDLPSMREAIVELEAQASAPDLWDDQERAQQVTSRLSFLQGELRLPGLDIDGILWGSGREAGWEIVDIVEDQMGLGQSRAHPFDEGEEGLRHIHRFPVGATPGIGRPAEVTHLRPYGKGGGSQLKPGRGRDAVET